jgi:hypothetical protein
MPSELHRRDLGASGQQHRHLGGEQWIHRRTLLDYEAAKATSTGLVSAADILSFDAPAGFAVAKGKTASGRPQ